MSFFDLPIFRLSDHFEPLEQQSHRAEESSTFIERVEEHARKYMQGDDLHITSAFTCADYTHSIKTDRGLKATVLTAPGPRTWYTARQRHVPPSLPQVPAPLSRPSEPSKTDSLPVRNRLKTKSSHTACLSKPQSVAVQEPNDPSATVQRNKTFQDPRPRPKVNAQVRLHVDETVVSHRQRARSHSRSPAASAGQEDIALPSPSRFWSTSEAKNDVRSSSSSSTSSAASAGSQTGAVSPEADPRPAADYQEDIAPGLPTPDETEDRASASPTLNIRQQAAHPGSLAEHRPSSFADVEEPAQALEGAPDQRLHRARPTPRFKAVNQRQNSSKLTVQADFRDGTEQDQPEFTQQIRKPRTHQSRPNYREQVVDCAGRAIPDPDGEPTLICLECKRDSKRLIRSDRGPHTVCDKCGHKARERKKVEAMYEARLQQEEDSRDAAVAGLDDPFVDADLRRQQVNKSSKPRKAGAKATNTPGQPIRTPLAKIMKEMFDGTPLFDLHRSQGQLAELLGRDANAHFKRILKQPGNIEADPSSIPGPVGPPHLARRETGARRNTGGQARSAEQANTKKRRRTMTFDTPILGRQSKRPRASDEEANVDEPDLVPPTDNGLPSLSNKQTQSEPLSPTEKLPQNTSSTRNRGDIVTDSSKSKQRPRKSAVHWAGSPSKPQEDHPKDTDTDNDTETDHEMQSSPSHYQSTQAQMDQAHQAFQDGLDSPERTLQFSSHKQINQTPHRTFKLWQSPVTAGSGVKETPVAPVNTQALFDNFHFNSTPDTPHNNAITPSTASTNASWGLLKSILKHRKPRDSLASAASKAISSRTSLSEVMNAPRTSSPATSPKSGTPSQEDRSGFGGDDGMDMDNFLDETERMLEWDGDKEN